MDWYSLLKAAVFFSLAIIGIPANVAILVALGSLWVSGVKFGPNEKILSALALTNTILIMTRGLPYSLFVVGAATFFKDTACSVIVYISRLSRAMTFSLSSLLSGYQFLVMKSPHPTWTVCRLKVSKMLGLIMFTMILPNLGICFCSVLYSRHASNTTGQEYTYYLGYCIVRFPDQATFLGFGIASVIRDLVFVIFMATTSTAILLLLYRHQRKIKQMSVSGFNTLREIKAAKIVIALVVSDILFLGAENTIFLYILTGKTVSPYAVDVRFFFSTCYATVFPIIILKTNNNIKEILTCKKKSENSSPESTESRL
ncbi:olfactory receptor class A-like protein 1 [Polypterus senegalus]